MSAVPYMRMYWADYEADTAHLSTFEHGIYLMLIKNYWQRRGPLPADDARLAKIARVSMRDWNRAKAHIGEFFTEVENQWHHSRIAQELAHIEAKSLKNKRMGNANAKRTQRDGDAKETRTPIYTDTDIAPLDKSNGGEPLQDDPVKQLFDVGVSVLVGAGVEAKQARSLIGKWRKEHRNDGKVLTALLECRARAVSEPVEWLQKRLAKAGYVSPSGYEYRGDPQAIMREAEKRADWTTFYAIKGTAN